MKRWILVDACCCLVVRIASGGVFGSTPDTQTSCYMKGVSPDAQVTVKILARNLDIGGPAGRIVSEAGRIVSEDAVHYQVVVFDAHGNVVDNFGWSNKSGPRGHVFCEDYKRFSTDYDPNSKAEATMTMKDYLLVRNQFEYNERKSGYSLTNNGVTDYHNPEYKNGRENFNCQFAMDRFWKELKNTESFNPKKDFSWPGGNADMATAIKEIGEEITGSEISPATAIAATAALGLAQKIMPSGEPSGAVNTAPAYQTYTQDNTAMKQWAASQINSAYSQACAIADSEGIGGEYRSIAGPAVNQGLNAISSIPDQQTYTIPTQVQQ